MHPNRVFSWGDREAALRFAGDHAFAHIFTANEGHLHVVHVPILVTRGGKVLFHVARTNRIAEHLPDRRVLVSVSGREAYQSANWYVSENQVPTWLYEAVEIEGMARPLSHERLIELLDGLSERFEAIHQPEQPWTRGKMDAARFDAMTKAIIGFEVEPDEVRGTRKFNQHKSAEDRAATIAGQKGVGREDIVQAIGEVTATHE
jgi:transcriptional regulator